MFLLTHLLAQSSELFCWGNRW